MLQISEVVNSMKDLIDYSRETGTGPMGKLMTFLLFYNVFVYTDMNMVLKLYHVLSKAPAILSIYIVAMPSFLIEQRALNRSGKPQCLYIYQFMLG